MVLEIITTAPGEEHCFFLYFNTSLWMHTDPLSIATESSSCTQLNERIQVETLCPQQFTSLVLNVQQMQRTNILNKKLHNTRRRLARQQTANRQPDKLSICIARTLSFFFFLRHLFLV